MNRKYKDFLKWNIYQIYPRSFFDSNNDGIGDLGGIIAKLDYLLKLGINAIWICPCFKSPNEDNGYDISDYTDIMDEFGTMDTMKRLIDEVHKRKMKIILDFVPNHTSIEHKWFQESRKSKNNKYSDYYYWYDEPINDWQSIFGGSAWQYDPERKQYYLHSFAVGQADLNWDNPKVLKEMQQIIDFWISLGIDGFRCDVIDMISKDLPHNKNSFGPHLHEYISKIFGRETAKHLFTVGESGCEDIEELKLHCQEDRNELSTAFQFDHLNAGRLDKFTPKQDDLRTLTDTLVYWENKTIENDLLYALFTDNHDNNWLLSRIGNDKELRYEAATCIATMVYLLKGVPFIYQGQEIGMSSSQHTSIKDFKDVESLNFYNIFIDDMSEERAIEKINFGSRDNTRHPMSWNKNQYGGFSLVKPWMINHSRYQEINVEDDLKSNKSVFNFYQKILKLRKKKAILEGDFKVYSNKGDHFFIYSRSLDNIKYTIICNFEKESIIEDLKGQIVLSNYYRKKINNTLLPYEILVLKESI